MSREDGLQAHNFRMRSGRMDRGEKKREMMMPQPSPEVEKLARKDTPHTGSAYAEAFKVRKYRK